MSPTRRRSMRAHYLIPLLLTSLLLAACGGGGDSGSSTTAAPPAPTPAFLAQQATDGFNLFNQRRQQTGLSTLSRNAFVDAAAQGHSNYQALNDTITHTQIAGKLGFTAVNLGDVLDANGLVVTPGRLTVAGYQFGSNGYAFGEVIAKTGDTSGVNAASDLITAIFHRFVIFEPMFEDVGAGAATSASGATYFTADFAANGLNAGLGTGKFVVYPFANETDIPTTFLSDSESPDPVPNRNAVGFPISVHADILSKVEVTTFTVQPRGGALLPVQLLTSAANPETPVSAAAIIPLDVLASGTVYDVTFSGTVDGAAANRSWSFTTR